LLADRGFCSYFVAAAALARGAGVVLRLNASRKVNFQAGRRLGPGDKLVWWKKTARPAWMSKEEYADLPQELQLRAVRVRVRQRGRRTKVLVVVTTQRDPAQAAAEDLADLYRARWHAELDLRSIKQALQMDVLRGQSPGIVRKEVWAHLLAHNVVRGLMAQAARAAGVRPRELSFTGALQTLNAFLPYLGAAADEVEWSRLWGEMVRAIGSTASGIGPIAMSRGRSSGGRRTTTGSTSPAPKPEPVWSQELKAYGSALPLPIGARGPSAWAKWSEGPAEPCLPRGRPVTPGFCRLREVNILKAKAKLFDRCPAFNLSQFRRAHVVHVLCHDRSSLFLL
jgi:hypothetical protein